MLIDQLAKQVIDVRKTTTGNLKGMQASNFLRPQRSSPFRLAQFASDLLLLLETICRHHVYCTRKEYAVLSLLEVENEGLHDVRSNSIESRLRELMIV